MLEPDTRSSPIRKYNGLTDSLWDMTAIALDGVTKRFGDVVAVSDLSLQIQDGEIFGFLGPNGAGKTSTIDLLLDFSRPTAGRVEVLGRNTRTDSVAIRSQVGVLPEGATVWDRLTGRQHLEFAIESKGATDDPEALLERVGIPDAADRKAGGYSKGMAQRLLLAMALVGEPDLLILDEPSTGLDPNGAREMREIVREENARGATVFFSSHILEQVEAVCDRVGIMREGEMVAVDTIEGLRDSVGDGGSLTVTVDRAPAETLDRLNALDQVTNVTTHEEDGGAVIVVHGDGSNATILSVLEEDGIEVIDFRTQEASLDEVFRAYTTTEEVSNR